MGGPWPRWISAHEGVDHIRFLARLVEMEMIDRERRMAERCIKAARFPAVKSLDLPVYPALRPPSRLNHADGSRKGEIVNTSQQLKTHVDIPPKNFARDGVS